MLKHAPTLEPVVGTSYFISKILTKYTGLAGDGKYLKRKHEKPA